MRRDVVNGLKRLGDALLIIIIIIIKNVKIRVTL